MLIEQKSLILLKDEQIRRSFFCSQSTDMDTLSSTIESVGRKISVLKIDKKELKVKDVISLLVAKSGATVSVRSITYERKGDTAKLDLAGTAQGREALINFTNRLRTVREFATVYSPVSNLVKEKNIDFTVSISITP